MYIHIYIYIYIYIHIACYIYIYIYTGRARGPAAATVKCAVNKYKEAKTVEAYVKIEIHKICFIDFNLGNNEKVWE